MAQQSLTAAVRAGASDAAQRICKHLSPAVAKSSVCPIPLQWIVSTV